MKRKLLFAIITLLAMALNSQADIVITESVIDLEQQKIKLVGENAANNFRYTLNSYEWSDRGPQFQIVIEPIDSKNSAQFQGSDLTDENYWEPLFRRVTAQEIGMELTAQDNIKRLYVYNVATLENQFCDYNNISYFDLEVSGDYTIHDGFFSGNTHLKTFICNVSGTLTLGSNIVNAQPAFTVKVYTAQSAEEWKTYKQNTGANFTVDDSEVVTNQKILSVTNTVTVNKDVITTRLPNKSGEVGVIEVSPYKFLINNFTATATEDVTELFMDYRVYPTSQESHQHDWTHVYATNKGGGVWEYSGPDIDVLSGLLSNTTYRLEFSFNTNPFGKEDRSHYPTDGQTMSVEFTTGLRGDVNSDGEVNVGDLVSVSNYMAGDESVSKDAADVNQDGEVNVGDLVVISNIMSGNDE